METNSEKSLQKSWTRPPKIKSKWIRWGIILLVAVYFVTAARSFEINIQRIIYGMDRAVTMITAFFQPDFLSRQSHIVTGVLESITMTVVATVFGVILAIPISFAAAKNVSSPPVYYTARFILGIFRSLHVVILGVFFVILFGFGPFAGVLTMIINSIGFLGKLTAEEIENTNKEAVEAVRATGASWMQLMAFGVWPQIATRYIGLSIYRADMTFRQSTVIGLVGAGGIGAVLETAMGRYDFNTAGAILLLIIILVLLGEYGSSAIRRRLT